MTHGYNYQLVSMSIYYLRQLYNWIINLLLLTHFCVDPVLLEALREAFLCCICEQSVLVSQQNYLNVVLMNSVRIGAAIQNQPLQTITENITR